MLVTSDHLLQSAAISFVATLVVNMVMQRSVKETLRHSIAGVSFGTLAFSWGLQKHWEESDLIVLTAISAGYVDLAVKFGYDHFPRLLNNVLRKYGILEGNSRTSAIGDNDDKPDGGKLG